LDVNRFFKQSPKLFFVRGEFEGRREAMALEVAKYLTKKRLIVEKAPIHTPPTEADGIGTIFRDLRLS
jgi:hypothetical protein